MENPKELSAGVKADFEDSLTEVLATPGGKAFMRCGAKMVPLDSINSLQPYRPKHANGEARGTIIYYTGLEGVPLTWFWSADYEDVMDVFANSCRILASTEDDLDA